MRRISFHKVADLRVGDRVQRDVTPEQRIMLAWGLGSPHPMRIRLYLAALFILLTSLAFADPIALQSFEDTDTDTWAYTTDPSTSVPILWGRTDQAPGLSYAQDGAWFWASWLLDSIEASMSFSNVSIPPGPHHSFSFYYYSINLDPAVDQFKICLEYDNGTEWNNWIPLMPNTQAWSLFSFNIPHTASTLRVKILTQYTYNGNGKFAYWDNFSVRAGDAEFIAPVVINPYVVQRSDGSKLVDIYYDLFDANCDDCGIEMVLSEDGGSTFNIIPTPSLLSGDIGQNIAPGFGKHIIWDAGSESRDFDGDQFMALFSAKDHSVPPPENFVYVQAGTVAGITVSDFYIDKYELTQAGYQAIMGINPASGYGVGDNYPVYYVSWFDAIEYCNRRSMQEGLNPCFSYLSYGTNPDDWPVGWNTGYDNHVNVNCDFTAIGYRLPTEAEWNYAARGGLQTHGYTYSGSNNLGEVGWYQVNSAYQIHPVGQRAANELGTYDMSGNVEEWCWNRYDPTNASRVIRGGAYYSQTIGCTVSHRGMSYPSYATSEVGIRVCRITP